MYAFPETRLVKHKIEFCQQGKEKSFKKVSELKPINVAYLEERAGLQNLFVFRKHFDHEVWSDGQ